MRYTSLLVLLFVTFTGFAQQQNITTQGKAGKAFCGADAVYFASLTKGAHRSDRTTSTFTSLSAFPSYAIVNCGKFQLYYEDMITTNPQEGFSDLALGAIRRSNLCDVITYIQSVFDFSAVPTGTPIRIHVSESWGSLNPLPVGYSYLAKGGPYHGVGPGITNGYVYDYAHTGIDPNPGDYHADLIVNFTGAFYEPAGTGYTSIPFTFQDNDATAFVDCDVDLNRTLLHEMGHILGWISFINYVGGVPGSVAGSNLFSGMDYNITKGTVFPWYSLNKLILGPTTSPYINPLYAADTNALDNNDLWLNNLHAPDNHPVYSETKFFVGSMIPSLVTHLEDFDWAYIFQQRYSPGLYPGYIMAPKAIDGDKTREYTKAEIQNFHTLGYNITSSFMTTSGLTITNHIPYCKRMARYIYNMYTRDLSETIPADFAMTNNTGASMTINLNADTTIVDADGDLVSVMPGTLVNLRGCGSGGNNHNLLTVSPDGHSITYTPRPNFYGRAQFCLNVWDGKETGAYVVYTIDVAKGTAVSTPPGTNLVLNGNFEEGTEVKLQSTVENIPYTPYYYDGHYPYFMGQCYTDSHPFSFNGNVQNSSAGFAAVIKNSYLDCNGITYTRFAACPFTTFPLIDFTIHHPLAVDGSDRYKEFEGYGYSYFSLGDSVRKCHRYILDFDYFDGQQSVTLPGTNKSLSFGFVKTAVDIAPAYTPANLPYLDSFVLNIIVDTVWHHETIHFTYCSDTASELFCIGSVTNGNMLMDNLSIKEDTAFTSLAVVITDTITGLSHKLTASTTSIACGTTYLWSTGATTPVITVTATGTSTTYSVTVNDGCDTGANSVNVGLPTLGTKVLTPNMFSIFPNPAGNTFTISSSQLQTEPVQMQILDMSGRQAGGGELVFQSTSLQLRTELPNGVYIIKLTDAAGNQSQQRMVICR